jgi:NAD(P)H-flavin reductase
MISPGGNELAAQQTNGATIYTTELLARRWISDKTFEIKLARPPAFQFEPGQRIRLIHENIERDYSLVSVSDNETLSLCIRYVESGEFSPILATAQIGSQFYFSGPHGYFSFQPSRRPAIFVSTGTGIAPFCAMARSGITGFTLLHGVKSPDERYYASEFRASAKLYVACLSGVAKPPAGGFQNRVTGYLQRHLPSGSYDFYLCGRGEMIRDVTLLIDDRFQGSLVYTEIFY